MNKSKKVRKGKIDLKSYRQRIRDDAKELGLSYNTVKRNALEAFKCSSTEERQKRYNELNRLSVLLRDTKRMKQDSRNSNPVTIYRNPMLWGMLDIDRYCYREVNVHNYNIAVGEEYMKLSNSSYSSIRKLTFEQLVLLSAIYSQLKSCKEKPDFDNRYPVSLRSIYEYVHGKSMKWCRVSDAQKKELEDNVTALEKQLHDLQGCYHYTTKKRSEKTNKLNKSYGDIEIGYDFFLHGNWVQQLNSEDHKYMCYRGKIRMFEIYKKQEEMLTTLPEDMLAVKNERRLDGLKYYLAYRVVEGNGRHMHKVVSYEGIVKLFGADHREFVKRYMKFLEEKGHVKNLKLDKDAVRWE